MNFCEFSYINFYGYYKNFIITLILTWFFFFFKKSPIINSALTKLLSLTRLEPSQQQQQQQLCNVFTECQKIPQVRFVFSILHIPFAYSDFRLHFSVLFVVSFRSLHEVLLLFFCIKCIIFA